MIAAFRYAISRYGSMSNIPGVVAVRGGGSYVGY
jgi:SLT domain-containing protein